ncbi:GOLD domain-containing protein [Entamoeba marina]
MEESPFNIKEGTLLNIQKERQILESIEQTQHTYQQNLTLMKILNITDMYLTIITEYDVNDICYVRLSIHNELKHFMEKKIPRNSIDEIQHNFNIDGITGFIDIQFVCRDVVLGRIDNIQIGKSIANSFSNISHSIVDNMIYIVFDRSEAPEEDNTIRFYKEEQPQNESTIVKEIILKKGTIKLGCSLPKGSYIFKLFPKSLKPYYYTAYVTSFSFTI